MGSFLGRALIRSRIEAGPFDVCRAGKTPCHNFQRGRVVVDEDEAPAQGQAGRASRAAAAKKSSTRPPGGDEAATTRLTMPSGFCVG